VACRLPVRRARGRGRRGRDKVGPQDRPGPAPVRGAPAGTRQETMAVAGGPKDVVRTPAPAEAMTGTGTVPRPTGVSGPRARAPGTPAGVPIAPRAVRTTEEQAPVVGRAPTRPTSRVAVTGTAPAPLVLLMGAPGKILLAQGPVRAAVTALAPVTAVLAPPTALPAPPIAVPAPLTALGLPAAATGPSVVPAARAMETAIVGEPPDRNAAAPGRTGSSPGRGCPGPAGRCRADGAASPAMAPGTWKSKARRHRRSGLKPAGNSPGVGLSDRRWPRIFGPSARPGPGSRPGRALSAPATLCSGRAMGLVRASSRLPPPDRRGSVPHAPPGGAVPGPPRPAGRLGPPARW
jgi:hypothetical protein